MKTTIAFLCLLLVSATCSAQHTVYRMDRRSPENIFFNGFSPVGTDTNLYLHVESATCFYGDRTSGFVSTTSDQGFAVTWGAETVRAGTRFYVYGIRPDDNFYNTDASLMHAYSVRMLEVYRNAAESFAGQHEWVSAGPIPRHRVVGAIEYVSRGPGIEPERVTNHANPRFIESTASLNREPYEWDYREDDPDAITSPSAVCSASCFSFAFHTAFAGRRQKRDVGTTYETMDNVLRCRKAISGKVSALLGLFDYHPTQRTKEEK